MQPLKRMFDFSLIVVVVYVRLDFYRLVYSLRRLLLLDRVLGTKVLKKKKKKSSAETPFQSKEKKHTETSQLPKHTSVSVWLEADTLLSDRPGREFQRSS